MLIKQPFLHSVYVKAKKLVGNKSEDRDAM